MLELAGLVLSFVGFITGGAGGVAAHEQSISTAYDDAEDLRQARKNAAEMADLQREQARASYDTAVEHFEESMAEQRVTAGKQQATGERQAGQAIFDTMLAGGRATGETEANLAGTSGLRRGGSVETVIEEVEKEYSTEVERQEERLSSNQDLFDTQLEQSFAAEERQIDAWEEQFNQTIEMIDLQETQYVTGVNTDLGRIYDAIDEMSTLESKVTAFFGGADVGRFGNALANYAAGLPEAPATTYGSTGVWGGFEDPPSDPWGDYAQSIRAGS